MTFLSSVILCLFGLTSTALSLQSAPVSQACNEIYARYPRNVAYPPGDFAHFNPSSLNFTYTVTHYWNSGHGQLVPSCVFYPRSASDVSFAVKVLNKYPSVPWAAKGGGHNPNKNWSSVDKGVLLSFRPFMQSTALNSDQTADVQAGSRWIEAVQALQPYGRAVVGGRLGDVGVAGYTLGGGLSFLSSQYGLACDLVVEYEAVLADGTIAKVNNQTNTDLFYALKGGGNQFAIITTFKMRTVSIGQVWGGIKIYGSEQAEAVVNATYDFATNYPDMKAAIIPTFESLLNGLADIFFVFYFYDGPTVPAGVFDTFNAIPAISDQTKIQTYADLLQANNAENIYGFNYLIRAQTIPLIAGDEGRSLLKYQYQSFLDYSLQTQYQNLDLLVYSFAMQPMPVAIQKASLNSGSKNTYAFDATYGDRIWMEYDISWINPLDEQRAIEYLNHFTDDIVQHSKKTYPHAMSTHQEDPAADQYGPNFLNDGMFDQPTSLFFKPDVYQRLKQIQKNRDPQGFFSRRTGGAIFK